LRKKRAGTKSKKLFLPLKNHRSENIGRQQITGKLKTLKSQAANLGQSLHENSFTNPGKILNQQMASGEQSGKSKPYLQLFPSTTPSTACMASTKAFRDALINFSPAQI